MLQSPVASYDYALGSISLIDAPIVVDTQDYEGVHLAAATLAKDIAKVTDRNPPAVISKQILSKHAIIVGSLAKSSLIRELASIGKISVTKVQDKWETWFTTLVDAPWDGCQKALVVCGSDKRGTIYGMYTLSEQIGVSP
jgi:hypothetical protein